MIYQAKNEESKKSDILIYRIIDLYFIPSDIFEKILKFNLFLMIIDIGHSRRYCIHLQHLENLQLR